MALAFWVSGSNDGGEIFKNKITSNVTPVILGGDYGPTAKVKLYDNTFVRAAGAPAFKTVRVEGNAKGVELSGNKCENGEFNIEGTGQYTNK